MVGRSRGSRARRHRRARGAPTHTVCLATAAAIATTLTVSCVTPFLAPPTPADRIAHARALAADAGFAAVPSATGVALPVAAWHRPGEPTLPARLYLEGDGLAFLRRGRRSNDPTPERPVALELAAVDPYPGDVFYVARPCQYETRAAAQCEPSLWTVARYGETVVETTRERIDGIVGPDRTIELVGFSGGGVVAALVAARRDRVARLVTVASPLDVEAWTRAMDVPALVLSLSPMDHVAVLSRVPQTHFASGADRVVPLAVVERFVAAIRAGDGAGREVDLVLHPDRAHTDWPSVWPVDELARQRGGRLDPARTSEMREDPGRPPHFFAPEDPAPEPP